MVSDRPNAAAARNRRHANVVRRLLAAPSQPSRAAQVRVGGTAFTPNAAGYASMTASLEVFGPATEVLIRYDRSLDASELDAVKKAITDAGITIIYEGGEPKRGLDASPNGA